MPLNEASIVPKAILQQVVPALAEFFKREADLLEVNVNERSLTHKLAEHLQLRFLEWNVDCKAWPGAKEVAVLRGYSNGRHGGAHNLSG
jgi:hypothetical protein